MNIKSLVLFNLCIKSLNEQKKRKAKKHTEYQSITNHLSIIIAKSVTLCVAIGGNKVAIEIGAIAIIKLLYTSKLVYVWQMWQ